MTAKIHYGMTFIRRWNPLQIKNIFKVYLVSGNLIYPCARCMQPIWVISICVIT